jgi:hypothetical protein
MSGRHDDMRWGLLDLDERWPDKHLLGEYRALFSRLQTDWPLSSASWPDFVAGALGEILSGIMIEALPNERDFVEKLRRLSALGSMIMHLDAEANSEQKSLISNPRRSRLHYSSYPTSPLIGRSIASYVLSTLVADCSSAPTRIVDPTIEGAPLLLEMLLAANSEQRSSGNGKPTRGIHIYGIDRSVIATTFSSSLLRNAIDRLQSPAIEVTILNGDSFETLNQFGDFDAFINNPPWGALTDGANARNLDDLGPYCGYRDPYIAFVALGLRKLKPGGVFGFVIPFQMLTSASSSRLRIELLESAQLDVVCHLPRSVFPRLTMRTALILGKRRRDGERRSSTHLVKYDMTRLISDHSTPVTATISAELLDAAGGNAWLAAARADNVDTLPPTSCVLGDLGSVAIGLEPYRIGRGRPKQTLADLRNLPFTFSTADTGRVPILRGRDVRRYECCKAREYILVGPWLAAPDWTAERENGPRVFVREICARDGALVAAVPPDHVAPRRGILAVQCTWIDPRILCAILNSSLAASYVRQHCAGFHKESFGRIFANDLRNFPIPLILRVDARSRTGRALSARILKEVGICARAMAARDLVSLAEAQERIDEILRVAYAHDVDSGKSARQLLSGAAEIGAEHVRHA